MTDVGILTMEHVGLSMPILFYFSGRSQRETERKTPAPTPPPPPPFGHILWVFFKTP